MSPEDIAKICHETHRAWQSHMREDLALPWDQLWPAERTSILNNVQNALDGFTPEQLHESWVEFKKKAGWTYGPVKSETEMTHPNLVPYADLSAAQRFKDTLFFTIVNACPA